MIAASTLAAGALAAWLVGAAIIAPAMRLVPKPHDLRATDVLIPSGDHAVAAWRLDDGPGTPVVLLVHGVRANRLDMVQRARWLAPRGQRPRRARASRPRSCARRRQLWIVKGARHEDLFAFDPAAYEAHVLPFLQRNLKHG